jgi:predicted nucleotidyltransferase component of viral defense system
VTLGLAASIHARLLNRAKARGEDFNLILTRYALERFLYRLSRVPAREAYWLKGAMLFDLWFDVPHRPTRDADFLGFGPMDTEALASTIRDICGVVVDDGMAYDPDSITVEEIREEARYGGLRVRLLGMLGNARCVVQLDVGYGDAVTPGPEEAVYPTLLDDQPPPRLRVYPRAAVVAEKLEAIVSLGMANSRMKDYFDLRALAREGALGARQLGDAIAATFQRRGTDVPVEVPLGLSDEFARDAAKRAQWKAFLGKNRLEAPTLDEVVEEVRRFVAEPLALARQRKGL